MALLSDTDIREIISTDETWSDKNSLHIYPFDENSLTPVGYDLRVGETYASALNAGDFDLQPRGNTTVEVNPGDTVLVTTLEYIGMPKNKKYSGFITSKVSKVAEGLGHISTNVDPDYEGHLLIALHNPSKNPVTLRYGERFCTLNFMENRSPATKDSRKHPGRTDILLEQFVKNATRFRAKMNKRRKVILVAKGVILVLAPVLGYVVDSTSAIVVIESAMLGVAVVNLLPSM